MGNCAQTEILALDELGMTVCTVLPLCWCEVVEQLTAVKRRYIIAGAALLSEPVAIMGC